MGDILHNKKAQAAMEFLMTYGWAIIVVLLVLAALVLQIYGSLPICFS